MKKTSLMLSITALVSAQQVQADFVINDDLIVDGSACVGFDCVNGESFGFDTIRIKENNLRIKFDDTSTSASFPRNDWQLTANDSANGGAEKFSIDDVTNGRTPFTVEANAPTNSLYVDDGGRLGLGTSTPSVEIHTVDGDTPTLRLQQDGSSGFAPQTWDLAGNETNFFVRDVTNGSQLPFRIRPDAPTNSIFVDTDGDVGMGTASPVAALHVSGDESIVVGATTDAPVTGLMLKLTRDGFVSTELENTASGVSWFTTNTGSGDYSLNHSVNGGTELMLDSVGNLTVAGNITAGTTGSSIPDYVFDKDYKLRTLQEVKAFIEDKGHLPGVPSAAEIEKTGRLDMTKMQLTLLEKVEELTLYILEQDKTIRELSQQISSIESTKTSAE